MLHPYSVAHIGKQYQNGYAGCFFQNDLFLVLSLEEGITPEEGEKLFTALHTELAAKSITSLKVFDTELSALIVQHNFPAHLSLAAGYVYNDVLYVKTVGKGQVYFRRGTEFDLLMSGDKSASGYVQEYDMVLFTTTKVNDLLGQTHDIKTFVDLDAPEDIVQKLKNENYEEAEIGFIGVFVEFTSEDLQQQSVGSPQASLQASSGELTPVAQSVGPVIASPTQVVPPGTVPAESTLTQQPVTPVPTTMPPRELSIDLEQTGNGSPSFGKKNPFIEAIHFIRSKKIALAIVTVLFIVLMWSVVFGYQRRAAEAEQKKIETTSQEIDTKLQEAQDEAFLDPDKSLALIKESKSMYQALVKEVKGRNTSELDKINNHIADTEAKIVKREEKPYTEFYDMALDAKDAEGSKVYREKNLLAILDSKHKKAYVLDLDKKSLTPYTAPELAGASDIALYNEEVFFFSDSGIYKFITENKVKQLIKPDNKWKSIDDFEIYNGNLYLLDSDTDDIYKYLVTESGYSDKSSYFVGNKPAEVMSGSDLAIDSAIYISSGDEVMKYLSGLPADFNTQYPQKAPPLTGIFTADDVEQVYVWDTKGSAIYVLGKDGEYIRQIASSIIKKATDVFAYDGNLYVFDGSKLYTIAID